MSAGFEDTGRLIDVNAFVPRGTLGGNCTEMPEVRQLAGPWNAGEPGRIGTRVMAGSEQEESTSFIQHLAGGFEERRVGLHRPNRDEVCRSANSSPAAPRLQTARSRQSRPASPTTRTASRRKAALRVFDSIIVSLSVGLRDQKRDGRGSAAGTEIEPDDGVRRGLTPSGPPSDPRSGEGPRQAARPAADRTFRQSEPPAGAR